MTNDWRPFRSEPDILKGSSVAKYAGQHVAERLASEPTYAEGDYPAALKRAFLGTDEDLRAGKPRLLYLHACSTNSDPAFFHDPSGCTAVAALITADRKLYVVCMPNAHRTLLFTF